MHICLLYTKMNMFNSFSGRQVTTRVRDSVRTAISASLNQRNKFRNEAITENYQSDHRSIVDHDEYSLTSTSFFHHIRQSHWYRCLRLDWKYGLHLEAFSYELSQYLKCARPISISKVCKACTFWSHHAWPWLLADILITSLTRWGRIIMLNSKVLTWVSLPNSQPLPNSQRSLIWMYLALALCFSYSNLLTLPWAWPRPIESSKSTNQRDLPLGEQVNR